MIWNPGDNDQNIIVKDNKLHFFYLSLGIKKSPRLKTNNLMIVSVPGFYKRCDLESWLFKRKGPTPPRTSENFSCTTVFINMTGVTEHHHHEDSAYF